MEPRLERRELQRHRRRRLLGGAALAAAGVVLLVGFATAWPHRPAAPVTAPLPLPHPPPRELPDPQPPPVRPPQFLVVSFDGSGGVRLWPFWRAVARRAGAHFTFFVSGVYLLDPAHRHRYRPPRHRPGSSDIGFAFSEDGLSPREVVRGELRQIAAAYGEGDEIGTHFNGHFCAPYAGSVGEWSAADWRSELDQFEELLFHAGAKLPFGASEVVGERTPCLQGDPKQLLPVLAARGFRYDASGQAPLGTWPYRKLGVWELPLLEIPFAGHSYRVVSMDYNMFFNQTVSGLSDATDERQAYESLWNAFETSYRGNRAPLSFANHFETWDGGAYNLALARVVERACRLPEVRCASFAELADWLDAQPPARLRRYEDGRFPRLKRR